MKKYQKMSELSNIKIGSIIIDNEPYLKLNLSYSIDDEVIEITQEENDYTIWLSIDKVDDFITALKILRKQYIKEKNKDE